MEKQEYNWISVEDSVPDVGKLVLIITEQNEMHTGSHRGSFWVIGGHFSFDIGKPIYWGELPKPPEK